MKPIRSLALLAVALLLAGPSALAQTTFQVVVEDKTSAHPYFGMGHPQGYVIDGTEANELTLERGQTYTFQMNNVSPIHPFYLSTSESGGGVDEWTDGVTGNGASGNQTVTFTVPSNAPDLLWYQCVNHQFMGWRLNIINPVGTEQTPTAGFALALAGENPGVNGATVELRLDRSESVSVAVYDVAGRRVAVLHEGTLGTGTHRLVLDGGTLPAGVYLVRAETGERRAEQRITLVR